MRLRLARITSACVALALTTLGAPALGQTKPPPRIDKRDAVEEARRYLDIAARYCEGQVETALADLRSWDWRAFTDIRRDLREFGNWTPADLQCAAMVHTEAALRAASRTVEQTSHLNWARQLLKLPSDGPATIVQSFRRDWLVAVAALLHGELRFVELDDVLREARGAFPNDAQVLFAWGLLREAQTSKRLDMVAKALPGRTEFSLGPFPNRAGALREAEDFYRGTLALDGTFAEAQLRLGHVLSLRDRPDEALAVLVPIRDARADSRLAYLAALFAGEILERAGRLPEAEASYRLAVDLYPACQVALTASSHVTVKRGRRDEVAALVSEALGPGRGEECDEPWVLYDLGRGPEAEQMFGRLRARVRE